MIDAGKVQHHTMLTNLRRLLQLTGRSPELELDPRVQPIVLVGDLTRDLALETVGHAAYHLTRAAGGAGQFSYLVLDNPANSGVVGIVTAIRVWSAAAPSNVQYGHANALAYTNGGSFWTDGRMHRTGAQQTPLAFGRNIAVSVGLDPLGLLKHPTAGHPMEREWPIAGERPLIVPGRQFVIVESITSNVELRADIEFIVARVVESR